VFMHQGAIVDDCTVEQFFNDPPSLHAKAFLHGERF
jgi:ABC-type histidine transport system ATPase subunit